MYMYMYMYIVRSILDYCDRPINYNEREGVSWVQIHSSSLPGCSQCPQGTQYGLGSCLVPSNVLYIHSSNFNYPMLIPVAGSQLCSLLLETNSGSFSTVSSLTFQVDHPVDGSPSGAAVRLILKRSGGYTASLSKPERP
jgi:hypothetical protein